MNQLHTCLLKGCVFSTHERENGGESVAELELPAVEQLLLEDRSCDTRPRFRFLVYISGPLSGDTAANLKKHLCLSFWAPTSGCQFEHLFGIINPCQFQSNNSIWDLDCAIFVVFWVGLST